ncbi:MAG TPA: DoxX family protein [Candidatus Paceibacterota bacterium]|nr:DoxX family protein [Candidatus Paceibacterota bacterium]
MKNLLQCTCASKWGEAAPLILRVVTGVIFFMHGYQKLMVMGIPGVTGFLTMLGMPFPGVLAVLLIAGELLGGLFLILGLWTHWSAKVLAFIALVALFAVHFSKGFFLPGYEFILLLLAASVSLMITGPGKWSVDRKMMK